MSITSYFYAMRICQCTNSTFALVIVVIMIHTPSHGFAPQLIKSFSILISQIFFWLSLGLRFIVFKSSTFLPSLRILSLQYVQFYSDESTSKFISCCQVSKSYLRRCISDEYTIFVFVHLKWRGLGGFTVKLLMAIIEKITHLMFLPHFSRLPTYWILCIWWHCFRNFILVDWSTT